MVDYYCMNCGHHTTTGTQMDKHMKSHAKEEVRFKGIMKRLKNR